MSGGIGNGNSKNNIPPPPPLPPPLQKFSSQRPPKPKTMDKSKINNRNSPMKTQSRNIKPSARPTKQAAPCNVCSSKFVMKNDNSADDTSLNLQYSNSKQNREYDNTTSTSRQQFKSRMNTESGSGLVEIVRSDVPFFNEEECSDMEDEYYFPCCIQPNSPRYPPNPRPYREWDPSFLPASTNIQSSIGRNCRRCNKPVYVAELYLSSRGVYHAECYKCCLCGKPLDSWSVAEYKGEVFCKGCYRRNFGTHGVGFGLGAGVLQTP